MRQGLGSRMWNVVLSASDPLETLAQCWEGVPSLCPCSGLASPCVCRAGKWQKEESSVLWSLLLPWFPTQRRDSRLTCPSPSLRLQLRLEPTWRLLGRDGAAAGVKGPASSPASLLLAGPAKYPAQKPVRRFPRRCVGCQGCRCLGSPAEPVPVLIPVPVPPAGGAGALLGSKASEPETSPGNPGWNSRGAQPRGSEKKQITGQAPSILIKILSPAEPPTPAQPVPISTAAGSRAPADGKKTLPELSSVGRGGWPQL